MHLVGQKFGKLTVIKLMSFGKSRHQMYLCKCDCGVEKQIRALGLIHGTSKSCGCARLESVSKPKRHGDCNTRLYRIWCGMLSRCNYKQHRGYSYYGGRGVTVCDKWKDFVEFKSWAIHNGYEDNKTIDRKDNDKNYSPENCKWSTRSEQDYNRTVTIICTIKGENLNTKQVFEKYGISKKILYYRISRGMTDEDLIKSVGKTNRKTLQVSR